MGLYVEDFTPGQCLQTASRRVSEGDILAFAELVGDHTPIHVDESHARAMGYAGRIAHGPLAMSMALGLFTQLGVLRETAIGLLQLDWKFRLPVAIGDEVCARIRVAGSRLASKPGTGVVEFGLEVLDQHGRVVQDGRMVVLMQARGAG